ncbi:hypothetical protein GCM10023148_32100 [Actinokineospora soli]
MAIYDTLGTTYTATRRPDPRVAARVAAALRDLALRYAPERAVREQNALPMRYDLPAVPEGSNT